MKYNVLIIFYILFLKLSIVAQNIIPEIDDLKNEKTYTSLSEALREPDKVYKLKLTRKGYKKTPPEITLFTNLKYLDLSKNKIKEIDTSLFLSTNLLYLNLSKNNLTVVSKSISNLNKLIYLNIGENNIYELPEEIGRLVNLKTLDAWSNNLSFFPETLKNITSLEYFDLRSISIKESEQKRLKQLLPNTKFYFTNACACQN